MHRAWVSGVENHHPRTMHLFPGTPITRPQSARTRRGELQLPCRVEHRSAQPCVTSRGDGAERSRENLAHRFSGGATFGAPKVSRGDASRHTLRAEGAKPPALTP